MSCPNFHLRTTLFVATALLVPMFVAAAPQDPPSAPVTVVNQTTNPVPVTAPQPLSVTGSVTVSGTSNVNVTNASLPVTGVVGATQTGIWNIEIDPNRNQVQVLSSPSSPLHVFSEGSAPLTPFSRSFGLTDQSGVSFVDVPAGKLLIIEHVDFFAIVQQGETGYTFFREFAPGAQGPRTFHYVVAGHQFPNLNSGKQRAFANEAVRYFLEAGARLSIEFASSGNGSIAATVNITGQLVNAE